MKLPFVITIPHCSDRIPDEVRPAIALSDEEVWESTDIGTREIFGSNSAKAVLPSRWSRLVVDLNRSPDQRDLKGVIAHVDYHGRSIYRQGCLPDPEEIGRRLEEYYWPFHKRVGAALENPQVIALFDCHSLNGLGPPEAPDRGKRREDIVLGNNGDRTGNATPQRGEITCPAATLQMISEAFQGSGFSVAVNDPYTGGFITTHYGREIANHGKIALQIEINQDLYLEAGSTRPVPEKLKDVRSRILRSFDEIARRL